MNLTLKSTTFSYAGASPPNPPRGREVHSSQISQNNIGIAIPMQLHIFKGVQRSVVFMIICSGSVWAKMPGPIFCSSPPLPTVTFRKIQLKS